MLTQEPQKRWTPLRGTPALQRRNAKQKAGTDLSRIP